MSFLAWLGNGLGSSQNLPLSAQSLENDALSDLKATPMDMGAPFETYGIYGVGATLSRLGRRRKLISFLCVVPEAFLFGYLMSFIDFGVKMVLQIDYLFPFDCFSMWSRRPQVAPEESRRRLGAEITAE